MKTLKLQHDQANDIRNGTQTSTWLLYDDKNLAVNDEVELIDTVDPANPESWKVIGAGRIDSIVEKRLGSTSADEYEGHGAFTSSEEVIAKYKLHYGSQVSADTPVKIIHFTFIGLPVEVDRKQPKRMEEAQMYADGGSRGNPGPSASGFVILDMDGEVVFKKGVYLGITTNNQAEYQALKFGMEEAKAMGIQTLNVYMDSLLVVNQMLGIFKVKNRDLWPIHESIKSTAKLFKKVTYKHVPRELNKLADAAVNETLDAQASH